MPNSQASQGVRVNESPFVIQKRVIGALFLREILTRYGRNNIGFLWLFLEPMMFTGVITAFWSATRSIHGSNMPIVAFALTGYSCLILWRTMPNRCTGALKSNKTLLHHRQVTIGDIYFARILVEIMATTTSFVALSVILVAMGWMDPPEDALQVTGGWALLAWFGAALGLTIGSLSEKIEVVSKFWSPMAYMLYPLAGTAFIVDALPHKFQQIVLWIPMLNCVEFLREGWFGSAIRAHYDITYVMIFNLSLTMTGLSLMRQVGSDSREE